MGKKYNAPYRGTKQMQIIDNVVNSKKKVQEELEEYKEKFNVDETTKVMLTPYEYPAEVAREI